MAGAPPIGTCTREAVLAALRDVEDPELPVSVVDLGLVYDVSVRPPTVEVAMTLTSLACPAQGMLVAAVTDRLSRIEGVRDVVVRIVWNPPWTRGRITAAGREELRGLGIAV